VPALASAPARDALFGRVFPPADSGPWSRSGARGKTVAYFIQCVTDRFAPEQAGARPRFSYFPFGAGPRQCIGNNFALMEMQLVVATIAQRYRLRLVPTHKVEADPSITLRPRNGIMVTSEEI
jgi:hypothetical protein